jgi:hypothetical protein
LRQILRIAVLGKHRKRTDAIVAYSEPSRSLAQLQRITATSTTIGRKSAVSRNRRKKTALISAPKT